MVFRIKINALNPLIQMKSCQSLSYMYTFCKSTFKYQDASIQSMKINHKVGFFDSLPAFLKFSNFTSVPNPQRMRMKISLKILLIVNKRLLIVEK